MYQFSYNDEDKTDMRLREVVEQGYSKILQKMLFHPLEKKNKEENSKNSYKEFSYPLGKHVI